MVMPRSRSRSIESSTCSAISRSARPPHIWMKRSASVDLPWSMCAMMEKLRMRLWVISKEGASGHPRAAILSQLLNDIRGNAVVAELVALQVRQDRHPLAEALFQRRVGVDVDLLERDAGRAQRLRHLLAEMAPAPAVKPSLCQ